MSPHRDFWSPEEDARLKELAGRGLAPALIAKQLNRRFRNRRTSTHVRARAQRIGVAIAPTGPARWPEEHEDRLRVLHAEGRPAVDIAARLNAAFAAAYGRSAVYAKMRKLGLARLTGLSVARRIRRDGAKTVVRTGRLAGAAGAGWCVNVKSDAPQGPFHDTTLGSMTRAEARAAGSRLNDDPHTSEGCRWIDGEVTGDPATWRYCGRRLAGEAALTRSYCAGHAGRVTGVHKRRETGDGASSGSAGAGRLT